MSGISPHFNSRMHRKYIKYLIWVNPMTDKEAITDTIDRCFALYTLMDYWSIESIIQLCHNNIESYEHAIYTHLLLKVEDYECELSKLCDITRDN